MSTEKWPKEGYGASTETCWVRLGDAGIPLSQTLCSRDSPVLTTANVLHSYSA